MWQEFIASLSTKRKETTLRCWCLFILPTCTVFLTGIQEVVVKQLFLTTLKEVTAVFRWKT